MLGHRNLRITDDYAELDQSLAGKAALKLEHFEAENARCSSKIVNTYISKRYTCFCGCPIGD